MLGVGNVNLFKNKVGRPSNETLKKRKIFKYGILCLIFSLILPLSSELVQSQAALSPINIAKIPVADKAESLPKTVPYPQTTPPPQYENLTASSCTTPPPPPHPALQPSLQL